MGFFHQIKNYVQRFVLVCAALGIVTPTSVLLQWRSNTETDLAGYKVYWGTESRKYKFVANAGLDTTYTVDELKPGYHYYMAVTSFDHIGNESDYSEEVTFYIEPPEASANSSFITSCYNFPNPFNPQIEGTRIRYILELPLTVSIKIMDANEQPVRTVIEKNQKNAGEHIEDVWDGKNDNGYYVPNGLYYGIIETGKERHIIKIAVIN